MLAITCPGQGAQTPGFLQPWLDIPEVADRLGWLSAVSGVDLLTHGTTSDADTIRDTAIAQPLIVAAALAIAPTVLGTLCGPSSTGTAAAGDGATAAVVLAGHSVGEFAASALAGVLTDEQAIVLVRERGRAMAAASTVVPTGMSAVVGGDPEEVSAALTAHGLTPANVNAVGQVVAAGPLAALAELKAAPPARAKVIPLQVAGAFHTRFMEPAVVVLADLAQAVTPGTPRHTLLSNADGTAITDGRVALTRLVTQISNPVRWDLCTATMAELGVTGMIEFPPAGTLSGIAKRALPGVELVAVKSPADLDAARAVVRAHAGTGASA